MIDVSKLIERLGTIKAGIDKIFRQGAPDSAELMQSIISYIQILEVVPEVVTWLDSEKKRWLISGKNHTVPNIWFPYEFLYSIYNYYRNGIGQLPEKIHFAYENFSDFHSSVIAFLTREEVMNSNQTKLANKLSFDENLSILYLDHYKIKIAQRKEKTNSHKLLNYIFSQNISNRFSFYDIMAEAFEDPQNDELRKCHTAAIAIQNKIIKETKGIITDFLDIGSGKDGYVMVNSKYYPQIS